MAVEVDKYHSEKTFETEKFVFFGLARGGSSIGFQIVADLFRASGKRAEDIVAHFHRLDIDLPHISPAAIQNALDHNDLIGCMRDTPPDLGTTLPPDVKAIFIVRDPRDCVLSWYHAQNLHLHSYIRPASIYKDFDEYLEDGDPIAGPIERILKVIDNREHLILHYHDLVYNPVETIKSVIAFCNLSPNRAAVDNILTIANSTQIISSEGDHNRNGGIGQALVELTETQLEILNTRYDKILERFGYTGDYTASIASDSKIDRVEFDAVKRHIMRLSQENGYRIGEIREIWTALKDISELLNRRFGGRI